MKELDNETGLYYYGMRYYVAWICRFISVDPLQHKYPELTPFQYASDNPITMIDLDGLEGIVSPKSGLSLTWLTDPIRAEKQRSLQVENSQKIAHYSLEVTGATLKTLGEVAVALSEIPGQAHYGDKIAEENKATTFPATNGQDFLSMGVGAVASPVIATGELIKDPTNPEKMGEFIAITGLMIASVAVKGGKGVQKSKNASPAKTFEGVTGITNEGYCGHIVNAMIKHRKTGKTQVVEPVDLPLSFPKDVSSGVWRLFKNKSKDISGFTKSLSNRPVGEYGAIHINRGQGKAGHFLFYEIESSGLKIYETTGKKALNQISSESFKKTYKGHTYLFSPAN